MWVSQPTNGKQVEKCFVLNRVANSNHSPGVIIHNIESTWNAFFVRTSNTDTASSHSFSSRVKGRTRMATLMFSDCSLLLWPKSISFDRDAPPLPDEFPELSISFLKNKLSSVLSGDKNSLVLGFIVRSYGIVCCVLCVWRQCSLLCQRNISLVHNDQLLECWLLYVAGFRRDGKMPGSRKETFHQDLDLEKTTFKEWNVPSSMQRMVMWEWE